MLLIISIIFVSVAIMKYKGFDIIHRVKIERSENRKKYDNIISVACLLVGATLLVFYLDSSRWFYGLLESEVLLDALFVLFFVAIALMLYAPIVYQEGVIGKALLDNDNNRSRKVLKVSYGVGITALLLLTTLGILFSTEYGRDLHILFLGMDTAIVSFILIALMIISVFIVIAIKKHNNKTMVFVSTLVMIGSLLISFFMCVMTTGGDYRSVYSPDLKRSIVIEEWAFLVAEGVNIYERENLFFIREMGDLPEAYGGYSVEWEEGKVVITVHKEKEEVEICEFALTN